jgi:putative serine protease PepD
LTDSKRGRWRAAAAAALAGAFIGAGVSTGVMAWDAGPVAERTAVSGPARPPGLAGAQPEARQEAARAAGQDGPAAVSASFAPVVREVVPSVVLIRTEEGLGSGVILDRQGHVVTNAHVTGLSRQFEVRVAGDPAPRSAHLVGRFVPGDLAVIRADDPAGMTPASFADSGQVRVGDVVLAVGNPLGLASSVTEGIVSATGRAVTEPPSASSPGATLPDVIQTSAPINPGNSGGALVNLGGEVIGIPTLAAASPAGGGPAPGIGFAIPSSTVRDVAGQLIAAGSATAPRPAS